MVWRSEEYRFDQPPGFVGARSDFDVRMERIYGRVLARFGSFEVRGMAIEFADNPCHVPIGLLTDAMITRRIAPGGSAAPLVR